jgi:tetratricopeptide (TPR) repeat protein
VCRSFAAAQSPRAVRPSFQFNVIGASLLFSRRFDQALPKLLLAIQDDPSFPQTYRYLAACYAHLGRFDEARETVERLRAITPTVVVGATPSATPIIASFCCWASARRWVRCNEPNPVSPRSLLPTWPGIPDEGECGNLRTAPRPPSRTGRPEDAPSTGCIVKNTGGGFLADHPSVVDAVRCAVDLQRGHELAALLECFPRLRDATAAARHWKLIGRGQGFTAPIVDQDISLRCSARRPGAARAASRWRPLFWSEPSCRLVRPARR